MGCKSGKPERLRDTCVIYYSREDKCWVAHSVRTDQIGMDDCVVHALADLMRAVEQVLRIAGEDRTIAVLRDAPAKIRKLAESARPLPQEISEIAHKMVHGDWPDDLRVDIDPPHGSAMTVDITEEELVGA